FRTRCWKAQERCATEVPLLAVPEVFSSGPAAHPSACHFAAEKRVVPQVPPDESDRPGGLHKD
ncbi:peptide ABC transporter ATP-binding protein, partial [Streptomyces sp. WAC05950]